MKNPKYPHNQDSGGSSAVSSQKLTLISVRLSKPQREKLNRLGGTAWLREQIDKAILPSQESKVNQTPEPTPRPPKLGQCQCKNTRGFQCFREATAVLQQVIDGQTHEFRVCREHSVAFQQGTLSISGRK
jgi:hypothetical protein